MDPVSKAAGLALLGASLGGTALAQAISVPLDSSLEKVGIVGVVVGGAVWSIKYFVQQVAAKDAALARMHEELQKAATTQSEKFVAVIRQGYEQQAHLQAQFTTAVNDMHVTLTGVQSLLGEINRRLERE